MVSSFFITKYPVKRSGRPFHLVALMPGAKAPVITPEWQFAQKIFTKKSDNMHHQFCKQMPGRFS
jgi:hypothetical protein